MTHNPYAEDLAGREPIASLAASAAEIAQLTGRFDSARWGQSYAPGKWNAAELLLHLAQLEMVFGTRVRYALATAGYIVQVFDQEPFMEVERRTADGPLSLASYQAQRAMNLRFYRELTPEQLAQTLDHPELGTMTVLDLLAFLAGHDWRHVGQLRVIAEGC